jgi:UDP-2-acetamido-2,6-beta-L-arabino-hexul-4-ose reductase
MDHQMNAKLVKKNTSVPIQVGITGQNGFIGSHLINFFRIQNDIKVIEFNREYFASPEMLEQFVSKCDVIIQLAAMSRSVSQQLLYENNIELDKKLVKALENTNSKAHVLFASTTHEMRDGDYYASKRDGQNLFKQWAEQSGSKFTVMVMPNTFGPYGKPVLNSVVSTFCYKVAHDEKPEIIIDTPVNLIYIHELCKDFYKVIKGNIDSTSYTPTATTTIKVSEILDLLLGFRESYLNQKVIPKFKTLFELFLFETFISYL